MNNKSHVRLRSILLITVIALLAVAGVVYAQTEINLPNDPISSQDAASLPQDKLTFLQSVEATEEAVQTAIPPASKDVSAPASAPTPVWPSGILPGRPQPLPSEYYYIENMWQDVLSGNHIQVYAGLEMEKISPPQGVLVIDTQKVVLDDAGAADLPQGEYLAPTQSGSLEIDSVAGTCLSLSTDDSNTASLYSQLNMTSSPPPPAKFQFDVSTRAWSCSSDANPPTPTP